MTTTTPTTASTLRRRGSRKPTSSNVFWLKLNFTIKTARLQSLKRQKYQHLQEEALLKARGLLQNWEDGPVLLTEDLYSRARGERDAQELLNYTPEALALRFSLRNDPDVVDAVKQLWSVELPRDDLGCIDQRGYAAFFRRVGRSLEPEASARRRRRMERTIREDWLRDSKGEPSMSFASFFDSVFELADLWCDSIDVDEYVAFLRRLLTRVTVVRRSAVTAGSDGLPSAGRRVLRPLKQVKVMDKDGSSSSSSSSDCGSQAGGIADDEEELPDENDIDGDDDDDEDEDDLSSRRQTLQVPLAVPEPPAQGFVATKALRGSRSKTPPSSASHSRRTSTDNTQEEQIPSSRRERRPSIITMGALSDDGRVMGLVIERDTSSAKSRSRSAKGDTPLPTLRETKNADKEDDSAVEAILAAHRSRSARPRTPVVVVDTCISDAGAESPSPTGKLELSVGQSTGIKQSRPARGQLFTAASGTPKPGLGHGSVQMDADAVGFGSSGTLASSGSSLGAGGVGLSRGPGGLGAGQSSAGLSGGSGLLSSSSQTRQGTGKKPAGVVLDEEVQAAGKSTRLTLQGVASSGQPQGTSLAFRAMKAVGAASRPLSSGSGSKVQQPQLLSLPDTGTPYGQTFISGSALDGLPPGANYGRLPLKTTTGRPTSGLLPFYSYEEGASPAKRLLPPMLSDNSTVGARGGSAKRTGSGGRKGIDFSGSLTVDATHVLGESQASTRGHTTRSSGAHRSNALDSVSRSQGASPPWFSMPRKENKSAITPARRSVTKQQHMSKKEFAAADDVAVAPWETSFDDDPDDDGLAKAVPRSEPPHALQQHPTPRITASCSSLEVMSLSEAPTALTVGLATSSSAPALPKYSPEPTTLPHEYHQLVLGSGAIHGQAQASLTSAPQSSPHWWPLNSPTSVPGSPVWRINGSFPRELALLDDGLEGRALVAPPGSSPRRVLTPLEPKRTRDCGCSDTSGLCPRFVEHCEALDVRPVTPSPLVRMEKPRKTRKVHNDLDGGYDAEIESEGETTRRYKLGADYGSNNNREEMHKEQEDGSIAEDELGGDVDDAEDVTVIVNATRCLVLRPGAKDRMAAKREQRNRSVTRSDMMRRRCQYTFGKHVG